VAHTEDDIDKSVAGFERTVVRMRDESFFDGA
jgi:hypothetical protein